MSANALIYIFKMDYMINYKVNYYSISQTLGGSSLIAKQGIDYSSRQRWFPGIFYSNLNAAIILQPSPRHGSAL